MPAGVLHSGCIFEQAPFAECHASTSVETPKGLVAAWFGGTRERSPDVVIWVSRLEAGAWTAPVEAANGLQHVHTDGTSLRDACWIPVLFQLPGGPLQLFYKVGTTAQNWWGMVVTSRDQGVTWSEPRRLPPGFFGPLKNKPVSLPGGVLLAPSSDESHEMPSAWRVHFERSTDGGGLRGGITRDESDAPATSHSTAPIRRPSTTSTRPCCTSSASITRA